MTLHSFIHSILYSERERKIEKRYALFDFLRRRNRILRLLKKMNCLYKISNVEGTTNISFNYQGGYFVIALERAHYGQIFFPNVLSIPYEQLDKAKELCNHFNLTSDWARMAYNYNPQTHNVNISIFAGLSLNGSFRESLRLFEWLLQSCFTLREALCQVYKQQTVRKKNGTVDAEMKEMGIVRENYLLREQERVADVAAGWGWYCSDDCDITVKKVVEKLLDGKHWDAQMLTVQQFSGEKMESYTFHSASEMDDYNLFSALIVGEGADAAFAFDRAVLTLQFKDAALAGTSEVDRTLYIMLKQEGTTEHTLYMRVTLCLPPAGLTHYSSVGNPTNTLKSHSFLLAYDLRGDRQKQAEFEYMWKDAQDKVKKNQRDELTPEQVFICECDASNIVPRIYWGRKYFLEKRYCQALLYLEDVYATMQKQYGQLSSQMTTLFFRVCYMIGFSYCELQLYEKAYFYLDVVASQNDLTYLKAYVNCLVLAGDFRALEVIEGMVSRLEDIYGDEDGSLEGQDDATQSFYHFLLRRKVGACINSGELEEAEQLCTSLLKDSESMNYALKELVRIQKLREAESMEKKNEK